MRTIPDDMPREIVTVGLPSGSERRLVLRLLAYWRSLQEGEEFPPRSAINVTDIADLWKDAFILDTRESPDDPVFRFFGDALSHRCGETLIGRHISEVPPNCLASVAVEYAGVVLERRAPMSRGGEFTEADGIRTLYRSILLPLSDDGETITGILGAANCRELVGD